MSASHLDLQRASFDTCACIIAAKKYKIEMESNHSAPLVSTDDKLIA